MQHSGIHEGLVQLLRGSLVLKERRGRQERAKEHIWDYYKSQNKMLQKHKTIKMTKTRKTMPTLAWKSRAFIETQRYQSRKRKAHVPAASDLILLFMAVLPRASVEAQRCGTRLLPHVLWTCFSVCMFKCVYTYACRCHRSISSVFLDHYLPYLFLNFMLLGTCVFLYEFGQCLPWLEQRVKFPTTGVIGSCKLPEVGARNGILPWKSSNDS